ncbi:UDP-glucose/GDP-mannose dehydrogenase family protein [Desulfosporosinus sp. BICA1-9]|uniref:UDP-glucose dehydrogenase family protein n=1 Tax=Desulfosporosinus sp. BICA1-9 TaxID=1531958 RepID=UPI00054BFB1D|nr:UDP-glucose/GDP-mannose dehydrogenase family protein [Desulfosporosinus sp. BICA1-9]KJS46310.1 MAG: UDP-glucose 6-dehydrogenase [Peptococcaceae bacterium BRH_c23]KJS84457.1 MAG: UDP-glucose 6-dehydrogenase [Desulfosporosinus sp. BICA1-9]HBW34317.1 UDP-glucose/GDP-mannose dehydrogenase family protein [Desulfosporosinus sp.]
MRICIVGAGYVGLTTAAALADFGHEVQCVDMEESKIESLRRGIVPIYEQGLENLIGKTLNSGKLTFSSQVKESIRDYPIIIIAVGTPSKEDGSSNLTFLNQVVEMIGSEIHDHKMIITKSTVPPGTNQSIYQTLIAMGINEELFDIVSNPEFLREGTALWDIYHPNRIVFGTKTARPIEVLKKLYEKGSAPLIFTSLSGAELIKYASNAFLATKISFANEIARICDVYEVDYADVAKGLATDPRIGRLFLNAGLGFGGSCLPKDLSSLKHSALLQNVETKLLDAVLEINETQIELYLNKLSTMLPDLSKKQITVWGVTFKPDTNDLRSSPAIALIKRLVEKGCRVHSFDPMVQLKFPEVTPYRNQYESVKDSDALIIATEWEQFINTNWLEVKLKMKGSIILDARNCLDVKKVRKQGLVYLGVGKR